MIHKLSMETPLLICDSSIAVPLDLAHRLDPQWVGNSTCYACSQPATALPSLIWVSTGAMQINLRIILYYVDPLYQAVFLVPVLEARKSIGKSAITFAGPSLRP